MKIKLLKGGKLPTKAYTTDAGYDIYLPKDVVIYPHNTEIVGLKMCVEIPYEYAGILCPRSSITTKGLLCQNSVIDYGYTGEIHLIITNTTNKRIKLLKNSRVCNLVLYKILNDNLEIVDELQQTERGNRGLGSSGK